MKVFQATYYWRGRWQTTEDREAIVVANTESEALGLVLEHYSETDAKYWTITEIDTTRPAVTHISSYTN